LGFLLFRGLPWSCSRDRSTCFGPSSSLSRSSSPSRECSHRS
jgi:hypothetical protein